MLEISPATLSLVVNHKPGISEATRKRVLDKLNEMGLSEMLKKESPPSLATERFDAAQHGAEDGALNSAVKNICFLLFKSHGLIVERSPYFLLLMDGIQACSQQNGYNLFFMSIDRKNSVEEQLQPLYQMDCAGVLLFAPEMEEEDCRLFADLQLPLVILGNHFPSFKKDTVTANNYMGAFKIVEYLVKMGHTRIGYLQSNVDSIGFRERSAGFHDAMKHFGLSFDPKLVFKMDFVEEASYLEFKRILSQQIELPSALVSDEDTLAVGTMRALMENGIRIPDDISIVGFNDRPISSVCTPKLTTARHPQYAYGFLAVDALLKRAKKMLPPDADHCAIDYSIAYELVMRDSVKSLR